MSKVVKKIIEIPCGVIVKSIEKNRLDFFGSKGSCFLQYSKYLNIFNDSNCIKIIESEKSKKISSKYLISLMSTTIVLIKNVLFGVQYCYEKQLKLFGVGYKASITKETNTLFLFVGFTHVVSYLIPSDVIVTVSENIISIIGVDKQRVGQVAAEIRNKRISDIYKGKGISYCNEKILLKIVKKK